jgi:hypothetical protein
MAIVRITPTDWSYSTSTSSHTGSYGSITNYENAVTNVDSDTYGTEEYNHSGYTSYTYFNGLDFSVVPEGAIIDSVSLKIKACKSSDYSVFLQFRAGTESATVISISAVGTPSTYSVNYTNDYSRLFDDTITKYLQFQRSSTSGSSYLYVYGIEIDIEYHLPPKIFNLILPRG